jgi:hypothetical protein
MLKFLLRKKQPKIIMGELGAVILVFVFRGDVDWGRKGRPGHCGEGRREGAKYRRLTECVPEAA